MSAWFWGLLAVSAVIAGLVFVALPVGPDLVYLVAVAPLYGAVAMLGWKQRDRLDVPPPDHPVWRNPKL